MKSFAFLPVSNWCSGPGTSSGSRRGTTRRTCVPWSPPWRPRRAEPSAAAAAPQHRRAVVEQLGHPALADRYCGHRNSFSCKQN